MYIKMKIITFFILLTYATAMTDFTCHKITGATCNNENDICAYSPGLSENYKCDSELNCVHPHVNPILNACNMSSHSFGKIMKLTEPVRFVTSNKNDGVTPNLDALYAKALRRIQATPDPTAVGNAVNDYLKDKFNEISCATEISESHFLPKGAMKWTVSATVGIKIPIVDANPWSTFEEMDRINKADSYLKAFSLKEHLGWSGPGNTQYATTTTQIEEHLSFAAVLSRIDNGRNHSCPNNTAVFNKYEQRGNPDDYCIPCPSGRVLYSTYTDVSYSESSTQRYNICIDCNGPTRTVETDGSCTINYAAEIVDSLIYDLYTLIMENVLTFQEYKTFISQRWRTCSQYIDDWVPGDIRDYKFTTAVRAKIECDGDNCIQIKTPDECNVARETLGIDGLVPEYSYNTLDFQFKYGNTEGCYFDNSTKRLFWVDKTTNGNFNTSGFYIVRFQEDFTPDTTYFGDFTPDNIAQKYWREKITEENIVYSEQLYGRTLYIQAATQFGLIRRELLDARDTDTNTFHIADLHDSESMMHNSLWIECAGDDCWSVGSWGETCSAASERLEIYCLGELRQTAVCGWDQPCNSNDFDSGICCTPKILCSIASASASRRRLMEDMGDMMGDVNPCNQIPNTLNIFTPTRRCNPTPIGSNSCLEFQEECCTTRQTCEQGFTAAPSSQAFDDLNKNSQCLNAVKTTNNLGEPTLCSGSYCTNTDFDTCCKKETCKQARGRNSTCHYYNTDGDGNFLATRYENREATKTATCSTTICKSTLFGPIDEETTCCKKSDPGCHPAESIVRVQHPCDTGTCISSRRMDELSIGDLVESEVGIFEPVIAFTHRETRETPGEYLSFEFGNSSMEISDNHYMYANGKRVLPSDVIKGNILSNGEKVQSVQTVYKKGSYHLHTWSTTLIVNGVKTSTNFGWTTHFELDYIFTPIAQLLYYVDQPIDFAPNTSWAPLMGIPSHPFIQTARQYIPYFMVPGCAFVCGTVMLMYVFPDITLMTILTILYYKNKSK